MNQAMTIFLKVMGIIINERMVVCKHNKLHDKVHSTIKK